MISRAEGNFPFDSLKNSRNNRLIRFRLTAFPTCFPTVNPKRVPFPPLGLTMTRKWGVTSFRSFGDRRLKSLRFRTRASLGKEKEPTAGPGNIASGFDQTVSLFLPLALLRLITFLPPEVLMRTKKPWVLDLLILLG